MKGKRLAVVVADECRSQMGEVERAVGRSGRVLDDGSLEPKDLALQAVADGFDVIGVLGNDHLTAAVARALTHSSAPRPVLPLGMGLGTPLLRDLDLKGSPSKIAARFAAVSEHRGLRVRRKWKVAARRLLRVTDSRQPASVAAFSLAVGGLPSEGASAHTTPSLWRWMVEDLKSRGEDSGNVRVRVDGERVDRPPRVVLASTLQTLPWPFGATRRKATKPGGFGLLTVDGGLARSALAMASIKAGRDVGGVRFRTVARLDLDLEVLMSIDGEVTAATEAYAVGVRLGPEVSLLTL